MLFIDARNYYTVVDRTLNEWSEWQLKNLNAIVWLYRGEQDKYHVLLQEYNDVVAELVNALPEESRALGEFLMADHYAHVKGNLWPCDVDDIDYADLQERLTFVCNAIKTALDSSKQVKPKREHKRMDAAAAALTDKVQEILLIIKERNWLVDKFGEGEYADVLGLCKKASIAEIEQKGWSLTPGAYVGVAPVEDDGVDFAARMAEIHRELLALQAESNALMDTISRNMGEMGV